MVKSQPGFWNKLFRSNSPQGTKPESGKNTNLGLAALLKGNRKYTPVQILGRGAYGVVLLAIRNADGVKVAIKLLARGKKITDRVYREISNHKILDHPNVVKFHEVFLTKGHLCIAMEFAPGRNLLAYVNSKAYMEEYDARGIFHQLILAIHYCHSVRVVSRDIKLDNTLIHTDGRNPPKIKICDFGYAKHMDVDSLPNSMVGTLHYLAPEIYKLRPGQKYDAQMADVWSCGVFLYAILTGKYPFQTNPKNRSGYYELVERVTKGIFYVPEDDISAEACDLLQQMMNINPKDRISLECIRNHAWFTQNLPDDFEHQWNYNEVRADDPKEDRKIADLVKEAKTTSVSENQIEAMISKANEESSSTQDMTSDEKEDNWVCLE